MRGLGGPRRPGRAAAPRRAPSPGRPGRRGRPGRLRVSTSHPLAAWILVGAAAGCSPVPDDSAAEGGEAAAVADAELRHVAEEVVNDNFAADRVDAFAAHIADDVTAFGPYDRRLVQGGAAMLAGLRGAAETKTTHRWEESEWHVQVYDDIGIVTFLYVHDATRAGRRRTSRNRATYVFHRRDGLWTLVHDHTSAVPARPGGAAAPPESAPGGERGRGSTRGAGKRRAR